MATQDYSLLQELRHHASIPTSGVDFEVAQSLLQHSRVARDGLGGMSSTTPENPSRNAASPSETHEATDDTSKLDSNGRQVSSPERLVNAHNDSATNPPQSGQICRYVMKLLPSKDRGLGSNLLNVLLTLPSQQLRYYSNPPLATVT